MFFIGIYWRSKIVTTPEYLEKRFNVQTRSVFSVLMVLSLIIFLTYGVYMGALLLEELLGWNFWVNIAMIAAVAAFYVIYGGLRAMLAMDVFQSIYLLITVLIVGITGFILLGGWEGIAEMDMIGNAGVPMNSLVPPLDYTLKNDIFYPLPSVLSYAAIAGLSWIVCSFSMAQRFLAAKDESHAQKALIMGGIFNVILLFMAYLAGAAMRKIMPDVMPDKAFITLIMEKFPIGIRGLMVAGLMAALLSTIDGLLSSSSSLITQDLYIRLINPKAKGKKLKVFIRTIQVIIVISIFLIMPFYMGSDSSIMLIQDFLGSFMGVLIAIFILGLFFTRTTSWASFSAMIVGTIVGFYMGFFTDYNFGYTGTASFLVTIILGVILSKFETGKSRDQLTNLTIWTLPDVKGPWIGLKAWPNLKWWAIGLPISWVLITLLWEWLIAGSIQF
jgi:SSS family solute:Na+ symporter